ncbi:uncharacterized protein KD926_004331 [Aspergillus affinis]|uniref:uncharacterized protein n=1 Tax=Aspergillus affinis TaxID=1070780 RepID=UPI0022FDC278|nr:uncharacterized protein KD926_004331 [Aspergillus affinis]KAI9043148.1 hypothetical protein KD926_004331 [Aspergillus affinis]
MKAVPINDETEIEWSDERAYSTHPKRTNREIVDTLNKIRNLAIFINASPQRREAFLGLQTEKPHLLPIQDKNGNSTGSLAPGSSLPQITINVLPSQLSQSAGSSSAPQGALISVEDDLNDVPGLLEAAVEEYATWHLSRVGTESYREHIRKARDIAWENCLDIAQIREESPHFFIRQGVAVGAARRFVGHTRLWLKGRDKDTA